MAQADKWAVKDPTERRAPEPLLYSKAQLKGRSRIYFRRRSDKFRFVAHLAGACGFVGLSLWWVIPVHSFAGPVLLTLTPGRGVHAGDLSTVPFLFAALWFVIAAARTLDINDLSLRRPA